MPSYKTPGVYVEEVERGPKPIEGVSTSTAAFLGRTERGPTEPTLVTSFADFRRTFGGYAQHRRDGRLVDSYLTHAVEGFFANGGSRAYVCRIIQEGDVGGPDETDTRSEGTIDDGEAEATDLFTVTARDPGEWGDNVLLLVDDATRYDDEDNQLFELTVQYWAREDDVPEPDDLDDVQDDEWTAIEDASPDVEEVYDDVSPDPDAQSFVESEVNGTSALIRIERDAEGRPDTGEDGDDGHPGIWTLDGGTEVDAHDDVGQADYEGNDEKGAKSGLAALEEVDDVSMVCAPDQVHELDDWGNDDPVLSQSLRDHCAHEDRQDRFALLQARAEFDVGADSPTVNSSYAAFYAPWLEVSDPAGDGSTLVPPGGHVAGVVARSDADRGVHKAPANEVVRGIRGLQYPITDGEQAGLNPKGVNCIRSFRGRGIRVWGARTTSPDPSWKYLNVRRLFMYLRESIDEGTQWAVFEPNDEELWARIRQTISNFLRGAWEDGALMGSTPEEAFYVKCDRSTMTQNDIDNGRLICEIGVAPVKPAEFVVFRIAQWTGEQ